MPRENNFRLGRGFIRERRLALSPEGYAAALEFVNPWSLCVLRHQHAMGARTL